MKIEFDIPDDLKLAHLVFSQTRKGALMWHAHVAFRDTSVMGYSLGSGQDCTSAQDAIDQAARHLRESKARIVAHRPTPLFTLDLSLLDE